MDKTFTASEVRDIAWSLDGLSRQMLRAFADLLEAQERAVPVGMLRIGADTSNQYGKTATFHYADACMDLSLGDHEVFPHPAPSDAERLAEALHSIGERLSSVLCDPFGEVVVRGSDDDLQIIAQALKDLGELAAQENPNG